MPQLLISIQEDRFDQDILKQPKPAIIDFWAPWCGPCKAMAPAFEALANAYGKQMVFATCNVDENQRMANRYGIKAIPTLMIFNGGDVIHSVTGMVPRGVLEDAIQKVLAGEAIPAPFMVN